MPKKIPMRKCVVSNERFPKGELLRVVRTPEGNIEVDTTGKKNGHGAYLKKDIEVLEILKRKAELIVEDNIISIRINYINMFKDDFDKIMEWLKNE